ncbi:cytochrome c-type biogenesis protein CcmH [Bacillus marinisedimentorum]|uniref:cytochrome c-type biogenesis protein CcmH n=1 Tax=Bacillus marinisedimentorum TaxID=1821260 RepID=UPI000872A8D9|nr:cytochrome c-type biogenesis protein CcmH [Bacillus marinisedimentorum]
MKKSVLTLILIFIVSSAGTVYGEGFTYNSIEFKTVVEQLDMQGHSDHELSTCSVKNVYFDEVIEMLEEGMTDKEIIDSYVSEYGQSALKTPDTAGSGLLAWLMPAAGAIAGGAILVIGLRKFIRKTGKGNINNQIDDQKDDTEATIIYQTIEEERRKRF